MPHSERAAVMTQPEVLFTLTLLSFCAGVLHRVWSMSTAVAEMRHSFELQDIKLAHLTDMHELGFKGFQERIEHSSRRYNQEIADIDQRLDDVESFLTKTTEFNGRR